MYELEFTNEEKIEMLTALRHRKNFLRGEVDKNSWNAYQKEFGGLTYEEAISMNARMIKILMDLKPTKKDDSEYF